jgi:20S proteasome subunit alpha 7
MPELDYGNIYSPNGSIIQHRYAQKAVDSGSAMISMKNSRGAVIIVAKPIISNLHVIENDLRIKKISSNVFMSYTGVLTDGVLISSICKNAVRDYENNFNTEISSEYFKKILSEYLYLFTSNIGVRVIGASFLTIVKENDDYKLLFADSTGKITKWNACATGMGERRAFTELEKLNLEEMNLNEMIDEGIKILFKSHDPLSEIKFAVEVAQIGLETNGEFIRGNSDEILKIVEKYKNLSIDGDDS